MFEAILKWKYSPLAGAIFVGVLVAFSVWTMDRLQQSAMQERQRKEVLRQTGTLAASLENALHTRLNVAQTLGAIMVLNMDKPGIRFSHVARILYEENKGVRCLQLVHDYKISHVYPMEGNEEALGLDLRENKYNLATLERAITTGQLAVGGPQELVQGGLGIIGRFPMFIPADSGTPDAGTLWGVAAVVMDLPPLLSEAGLDTGEDSPSLHLALQNRDPLFPEDSIIWSNTGEPLNAPVLENVSIPNGSWRLLAAPSEGWQALPQGGILWRTLGAIIVLVSMAFAFVLIQTPARQRRAVRRALATLREREARFRDLVENANDLVYTHDLEGRFLSVNKTAERVLEYSREQFAHMTIDDIVAPEYIQIAHDMIQKKLPGKETTCYEVDVLSAGGKCVPLEVNTRLIFKGGTAVGVHGIGRDITARRAAEEALRASELRLRTVIDLVPHMIFAKNQAGKCIFANRATAAMLGVRIEDLVGRFTAEIPGDSEEVQTFLEEDAHVVATGRELIIPESVMTNASGEKRILHKTKVPYVEPGMEEPCVLGIGIDITERKRDLEELQERIGFERLFTQLSARFINVPIEQIDKEIELAAGKLGQFVNASRCYLSIFEEGTYTIVQSYEWCAEGVPSYPDNTAGTDAQTLTWGLELMTRDGFVHVPRVRDLPPEASTEKALLEVEDVQSFIGISIVRGQEAVGYFGIEQTDREREWPAHVIELLKTLGQVFGNAIDRKWTGEALKYRVKFEKLITSISTHFINLPVDRIDAEIDSALKRIGELTNSDRAYVSLVNEDFSHAVQNFEWCAEGISIHKDDTIGVSTADFPWSVTLLMSGQDILVEDVEALPPEADSELAWFRRQGTKALLNVPLIAKNKLRGYFGVDVVGCTRHWPADCPALLRIVGEVFSNAWDRKRAEEDRQQLQQQIQHAQKLESLGVLAGGIAHDFNNLLMGILGNADLAMLELPPGSPIKVYLEGVETASRRAAELCRQMLAYSGRGRFVVEPVSLNSLIEEMSHLLQVSITKKAQIRYSLGKNLPAVEADATQLRQIIMNLITNASEALGDTGGMISLSTGTLECDQAYLDATWLDEKLPEGRYVFFEVSDSGCGMDRETLQKIFDPFFSTKFTGRGLGLAAAMGIVRGHQGALKVYTEVGKGSTFKVLLPACGESPGSVATDARVAPGWRGEGLVLLVDDEQSVRTVGKIMLEKLGFSVITANDGNEALTLFQTHRDAIVCVLLDLTMPNMDGEETFRALRKIDPKVCVILSSGYNEQDVASRFGGKGLSGFVQKPYNLTVLQDKLCQVTRGGAS